MRFQKIATCFSQIDMVLTKMQLEQAGFFVLNGCHHHASVFPHHTLALGGTEIYVPTDQAADAIAQSLPQPDHSDPTHPDPTKAAPRKKSRRCAILNFQGWCFLGVSAPQSGVFIAKPK